MAPDAADCPIARPSEKLCSPMPVAIISDRDWAGESRAGRTATLGDRGRAEAPEVLAAAALHDQLVEVDEAHQSDREADDEDRGQPGEAPPRAVVVERGGVERGLDRLDSGRQHVPEEEEQDARRGRAEQRAGPGREVLQAARGEAEEDRQPGDRPEYENLSLRHPSPFARWL